MSNFIAYYRALKSPDKQQRYEIVAHSQTYPLLDVALLNKRNPNKGGLSLNFGNVPLSFNSKVRNDAQYTLTRGKSISSIFTPFKSINIGYGDIQIPTSGIKTDDGLIIIVSDDFQELELFIAPNRRTSILSLFQEVASGKLDEEINYFRSRYNSKSA